LVAAGRAGHAVIASEPATTARLTRVIIVDAYSFLKGICELLFELRFDSIGLLTALAK
jgi:hypothetical protein